MTTKMKELKDLLKQKATEIRNYKSKTKEYQRKHGGCCNGMQWKLQQMKEDYRSHHIAYSMLRGRTLDEIEPNAYSTPNLWKIEKLKEEYREDVCTDAA